MIRCSRKKVVELSFVRGNAKEIAEELGIRPGLLYRWRREYQQYDNNSFPGKGKSKKTDLKWENAQLKKELRTANWAVGIAIVIGLLEVTFGRFGLVVDCFSSFHLN